MRILAIETTERTGGVAAMIDGKLLREKELSRMQRSAQSLAPAIAALLDDIGWRPIDINLVAVTVGPGSFTGLRVGVTTAKTFAYCCGAEILGINSLETIAAAAPPRIETLTTLIDAQRGEIIVQTFSRDSHGRFVPRGADGENSARLIDIEVWLESLPGTIVSGPILSKLAARLPHGVTALAPELWHPTAANVARLAHQHYATGRRDNLWTLAPIYSRQSAAEEKWAERQIDGRQDVGQNLQKEV